MSGSFKIISVAAKMALMALCMAVLALLAYQGMTKQLCREKETFNAAEQAAMKLDWDTCAKYIQ